MSFENGRIVLSRDSGIVRFYQWCNIASGNWDSHVINKRPEFPSDLCTLMRGIVAGLLMSLYLAVMMMLLAAAVGGVLYVIYMAYSTGFHHFLKTSSGGVWHAVLMLALCTLIFFVGCCLMGVAIWAVGAACRVLASAAQSVGEFIFGFLHDIGWLRYKPLAKKKHKKSKAPANDNESGVFSVIGQWVYDRMHGICRKIEVKEAA